MLWAAGIHAEAAGIACTAQQRQGSQTQAAWQQTRPEAIIQQQLQNPSEHLQGSQQKEKRQLTLPETAEEHAIVDRLVAESLQHGLLHRQEASDHLQHKAAADAIWHYQRMVENSQISASSCRSGSDASCRVSQQQEQQGVL